jgi:hypothetical protein
MRDVQLGQRFFYAWHLTTMLLIVIALGIMGVMVASLKRDHLGAHARQIRFNVIGWAAVFASLLSVVVWPYLHSFTNVRVDRDGTWRLENYLGVQLAELTPHEVRSVRAYDLGGLHAGMGHIEIVRSNGARVQSVRVGGVTFQRLCKTLGYLRVMQHETGGYVLIQNHVYLADGPHIVPSLALR